MTILDRKILYLLRTIYNIDNQEEEQNILSILEKMTEEEKIDIAYTLKKRLDILNSMINQAMGKLKVIDYGIEDVKIRQNADKWLDEILLQID